MHSINWNRSQTLSFTTPQYEVGQIIIKVLDDYLGCEKCGLNPFRYTMPIYEDEAIVLRQYPLAESDSIVVCIAPELGKIRVVAQGIKRTKSRFAGCLQTFNHVKVEYFNREGRDLGKIRHIELIHSYSEKLATLEHIFALTFFAELANAFVQENQSNPAFFRLMLASLKAAENNAPILPLVRYFEVWCLKIGGFFPNYAYCSNCGKSVKEEGFFARIGKTALDVFSSTETPVLAVLHKGVIRGILSALLNKPLHELSPHPIELGSIHRLERSEDSWTLISINETDHLGEYRKEGS